MARLVMYKKIIKKRAALIKYGLWLIKITKMETYFNIPNDDTLPISIQEVVAFGVTTNHFGNSPLHLWETGEHEF